MRKGDQGRTTMITNERCTFGRVGDQSSWQEERGMRKRGQKKGQDTRPVCLVPSFVHVLTFRELLTKGVTEEVKTQWSAALSE